MGAPFVPNIAMGSLSLPPHCLTEDLAINPPVFSSCLRQIHPLLWVKPITPNYHGHGEQIIPFLFVVMQVFKDCNVFSLYPALSRAKQLWVVLTLLLKSCFPDLQLFLQLFSRHIFLKKPHTPNESVPQPWPDSCWAKHRGHSSTYFWGRLLFFFPTHSRICVMLVIHSSQNLFISSLLPASLCTVDSSCV